MGTHVFNSYAAVTDHCLACFGASATNSTVIIDHLWHAIATLAGQNVRHSAHIR